MATDFQLRQAARIVRQGGIIAYPTEAVYGLGCKPDNEAAVRRLLRLKRRSCGKGLILIGADFSQLEPWLQPIPRSEQGRVFARWPGPVTWLLPARANTPRWLTGGRPTLAVRVTGHPLAALLCRRLQSALVSTSANLHTRPPARSALAVRGQFRAQPPDFILAGDLGGSGRPSEIRDFATDRIIRAG